MVFSFNSMHWAPAQRVGSVTSSTFVSQIRIIVTTFVTLEKLVLFHWLGFHKCLLSPVGLYFYTYTREGSDLPRARN